jgi:6-phosphogluconolactonase
MLPKRILQSALVILMTSGLCKAADAADALVFFGTHNTGPTRGFYLSHFNTETGALTAPTMDLHADAPAYFVLAPDGHHLYACNSLANFQGQTHMGAVSAYAIDPATGKLTLLNEKPSGGEDPSYISLDKTGHYALIANYQGNRVPGEGGTVAVYAIQPDGSLGERTAFLQHKGTSIDPSRQRQAYAHSIVLDPTNRFAIVADLGLDKVFIYKFNEKDGTLTPNDPPFVTVKPASGPRHSVFSPDGQTLYVVHEMGSMITAFHWNGDKGLLTAFQEISTLPPDFKGTSAAAEIRISPDGKHVYASNRGDDSIAEFTIDPPTGKLSWMGRVSSGGKTPRNFDFDPTGKWMLVTNHGSDNAVVFSIDPASGALHQKGDPTPVTFPFCPRFLLVSP